MTFQNDVSTFVVIEKEADAGAGAGTLTFKSGSASALTATQDAWLKVTLTDGTVYKIPAFSDDVTP